MLTNWEIKTNYIFGYNEDLDNINPKDIKSIYMFDLDYTLIKTKSGKKFPINKSDWELLYHSVSEKIFQLSDSIIGIISNQKGLKTQEQKVDWVDKIKQINMFIKIDFVFASISDDRYRKPLPGSFEFVKEKFASIDWDGLVVKKKIYYIGDAFGRPNDFSDTDIKYALNNNFKFKTPEIFFDVNKEDGKSGSVDYPNINYFTELEQTNLFDKLDIIVRTYNKILIITIGLPASGKSFIRKELVKRYPQFTYSNNDDVHDKVQSRMLIKKISTDYDFVIDDNTNLDKSIRDSKLSQFKSYYKVGIWFDYNLELCWHFNWMRMYWFGAKLLPKITYYSLRKKLDHTNLEDGFDKFIKINKVFKEMNLDNKIKYYF